MAFNPDNLEKEVSKPNGFNPENLLTLDKEAGNPFRGIVNVVAEPGAATRTGINALAQGQNPIKPVIKQVGEFIQHPGSQTSAPSGEEVARNLGVPENIKVAGINLPARKAAGVGIEALADPSLAVPYGKIVKPAADVFNHLAVKSVAKQIDKLTPVGKMAENMSAGYDGRVAAETLKNINQLDSMATPNKFVERMLGPKIYEKNNGIMKVSRSGEGHLSNIKDSVDHVVDFYSKPEQFDAHAIADDITKTVTEGLDPSLSAIGKDELTGNTVGKAVQKLVKPEGTSDALSLNDLLQRRRILGNQLSADFGDPNKSLINKIRTTVYNKYNDYIKDSLSGKSVPKEFIPYADKPIDAATFYDVQNNRMSNILRTLDSVEPAALQSTKNPSILSILGQGIIGGGMGGIGGELINHPGIGAGAGGLYKAARESSKAGASMLAQAKINALSGLGNPKTLAGMAHAGQSGANVVQGEMTPDQGRSPQSLQPHYGISTHLDTEGNGLNIPETLVRTPIPRTTEGIIQNKNFVKMKIAQQAPQLFDQISEILDHNPEYIGDLLPVIQKVAPHMFPKDEYNRIDGKIISPVDKQRAIKDTMDNDSISNTEKIAKIHKLNKTGEF